VRVALFKDSEVSFLQALDEAGIVYERAQPHAGSAMAAGTLVTVAQTAAVAGPVAGVLVAWLKARASRKVILSLHGNKVVHLEGYSVQQVKELLPQVEHMSVVDTKPADKI
jgi:hypothetical protein